MAKQKTNLQMQSDDELNVFIAENKKKAAKGKALLILGIVLLLITGFMFFTIGIAISIILIGIGAWLQTSAKNAIKECMSQAALLPALQEVFDKVVYRPESCISKSTIENTPMGFDFEFNDISGNDYVKAEYQGVSIELSDITLNSVTSGVDSDGDEYENVKTRFKGIWLICDFHKHFSADLLLRERVNMIDKNRKRGIKTENEAFNNQFYIESESEHDVFYILTPHMMEYIQKMDQKAAGRTYMRFLKEGKLVLAIDTGRDSFEVNNIRKANADTLRTQFISEVRYITDLIDELRLVKTLYKN